jgi:hypothetical protein
VGIKKADKKDILELKSLNFNNSFFTYLELKVTKIKNKMGNNKNISLPMEPKKFFGEIINFVMELVLSVDWKTNDANSF